MPTDSRDLKGTIRQFLRNLQREVDSSALYQALSVEEHKPEIADVYKRLATIEQAHMEFWKHRLSELGHRVPDFSLGWRTRTMIWIARRFGPDFVLPVVSTSEHADVRYYDAQSEAVAGGLNAAEKSHARIIRAVAASVPNMSIGPLANALRAAVLGANDGLASNLSLVMGVAGAHMTSKAILVTGLSGLVAGACAMAMGEWLSVSTSRESDETHVDVDAQEPADISEEEKEQLASIYLAQGISAAEARSLADRLATTRKEDFGGYALNAAMWSFLLFASGALFPVVPYFFLSGSTAVLASIAMSSAVLFLIGAGATLFTGRSFFFSGIRQLLVGLAAAGVTYTAGHFIGAILSS
ncbi:MAG: VIT1/CCC1 transporter family protein [Candidatus Binataceae bacterium]|jgi:VIT1/CCC1 family predicted Fe2+/Mn2+ transporter